MNREVDCFAWLCPEKLQKFQLFHFNESKIKINSLFHSRQVNENELVSKFQVKILNFTGSGLLRMALPTQAKKKFIQLQIKNFWTLLQIKKKSKRITKPILRRFKEISKIKTFKIIKWLFFKIPLHQITNAKEKKN